MLFAAFALVMVGVGANITTGDIAYGGAIIFVLMALPAPLFGFVWGKIYTKRYNKRYLGCRYCSTCQYDLTGNESRVCPECGSKTDQYVSIGR